ncbi:4133_t:CDS:2 [Paraglomus brasilianum]|uniref:4133_t:CDS:1 n=1 Tax=Paraglomus brasilianum TaxID=144538 RepID=A0A9N9CXN4_9GLOM|nr:4133_t:CDS:2 [Paraglomus brasilianum]
MSLNGDDDEKKFRKKIRKPSFKYARQFSDTLIGAHMDGSNRSKHKGVSKAGMNKMACETYPNFESPLTQVYRDCLFKNEVFYAKNIGFRTKDHIISLVESEKKALCPIDTKRWILSNGITSLAYGHWRIDAYKSMIKAGMSPELAEKRAMSVKLKPEIESLIEEHIA